MPGDSSKEPVTQQRWGITASRLRTKTQISGRIIRLGITHTGSDPEPYTHTDTALTGFGVKGKDLRPL